MKNNNKNNLNNEEKQINRVQTIISISCLLLFLLMVIITVIVIVNSSENTGENSSSKVEASTTTTTTTITPKPEDSEPSKTDVTTTVTTTPKPETTTTTPEPETTTTTVTTPEPETTTTTTTTPKPETTTTTTKPDDKPTNSSKKLDVVGINGYSDLISGSGITAAANVLGYYGINVEPIKLKEYADIHGTTAIVDGVTPSPWDVIVKDPEINNSKYYAKPIINMISNYLAEKGITNVKPKDVSGATLSELIAYIDEGKPIIVWGTSNGQPAEDSVSWILPNGEMFIAKEHMVVYTMIGYTENEIVILDDTGYEFNVTKEMFLTMYESIYSQAILIE